MLFNLQDAARVRRSITEGLGVPQCPCEVGRPCPLLPVDLTKMLEVAQAVASLPLPGLVV